MSDALLVMAYGTPDGLDDVFRYYTDIRRGHPPSPEEVAELEGRYRAIGGRSPLLEITRAQAQGLTERIPGMRAFVGQKHSPPFLIDAAWEIAAAGAERVVGLVMAPHYSTMSVGDYRRRAEGALAEAGWQGSFVMIESWHADDGYVTWLAGRVRETLDALHEGAASDPLVVFTAHSLPERIVSAGDPYPAQLEETAAAVADRAGLRRWRTGWQSAGRSEEPWLGPDLIEIVVEVAGDASALVVCPCGFVADHLEVLYDIDIEAAAAADVVALPLVRTRSPNDDPEFLDALAAVVGASVGR